MDDSSFYRIKESAFLLLGLILILPALGGAFEKVPVLGVVLGILGVICLIVAGRAGHKAIKK